MTSDRKIRILHTLPNFGPGGAERLVVDLLEATDKVCFEVAALSLYPEMGTILEKEIKRKGLCVYFLDKHFGMDLSMFPKIYRFLRSFRPDIVHTHRYVLRYTLLPALFCRIPVQVHTVHNLASREVDRPGKIIHWVAFRLASVVPVSISGEIANTVRSVYGQNIKTPVIYNGIPVQKFSSVPPPMDKENLVILHIGRFAPQKNHRLLIEAFALTLREYPHMQLWLAGDGSLRPAIEQTVKEKGLESQVVFLGIRDNVPELLRQCDMLVLSSDWEGMPITVLEAMAAARPVVATAVGGVPELVDDGVNGLLVPPGDAEVLAQGIVKLARDPALRYKMGMAGRRKALDRFDIAHTAREYEMLYLRLLEHKRL